jgi:hypothetical protein
MLAMDSSPVQPLPSGNGTIIDARAIENVDVAEVRH